MNKNFPLIVLAVALAIVAFVAWEPLRSRAGLLSPWPSSPATSPSPQRLADEQAQPTPSPTVEPTPDSEPEPTPEPSAESEALPAPRFTKCRDGSELRVIAPGIKGDGAAYKCGSGAEGAYLRDPSSR